MAHNKNELFAELPLGAARLSGKMKGNRALRTDYMLAGQYALPPDSAFRRADLHGTDCARATHVVNAVHVGAFAMAAGEQRTMDGSASLFGLGAGGVSQADAEILGDEGSAEACKASQADANENARCAVPLRIGLVALEGAAAPVQAPSVPAVVAQPSAPLRAAPSPPAATSAFVVLAPASGSCPAGMAAVPAGRFMMGSNDGAANEKPVHRVDVGAFCMDVTEVTTDAYAACVRTGVCSAAGTHSQYCNMGQAGRGNHPINCVDWNQATAYCRWARKRLPTEEEWEYGARGAEGKKYPWGSAEPGAQLCWNRGESKQGTRPVGSFPSGKSPHGLEDMAGNVWEWTSRAYTEDYGKKRSNALQASRVIRGGSWYDDNPAIVRCADRVSLAPTNSVNLAGFRCAR